MSNIFLEILGVEINFKDQNTINDVNAHKAALLAKIDNLIKSATSSESLTFETLIQRYPGIPLLISKKQKVIVEEADKRIKEIAAAELVIKQTIKAIEELEIDFSKEFDAINVQRRALLKNLLAFEESLTKANAVLNKTKLDPHVMLLISKKQKELIFTDQTRYQLTKADIELLIVNKKKKREINCFVIEEETTEDLSHFLDTVIKSGQTRTQLVYKIRRHWSALDILRDTQGKLQVFVLDAARYTYSQSFIATLCALKKVDVVFCTGKLQEDESSCSIFAMDHAFHMSKIKDLHAQMGAVKVKVAGQDFVYQVDPLHLPAVLVKNGQLSKFHNEYLEKNKAQATVIVNKKGQTLKQYIEAHKQGGFLEAIGYKQKKYRDKINHIKMQQLEVIRKQAGEVDVSQPIQSALKLKEVVPPKPVAIVQGITLFSSVDVAGAKEVFASVSNKPGTLT